MYGFLCVNHTSVTRFKKKKEKKTSKISSSIHENIEERGRIYACPDHSQRKEKFVIVRNMKLLRRTKIENKDKEI